MRLRLVAAEPAGLEHLQTRDGQPLAATVHTTVRLALVGPAVAGTGIEQDGDHEEVEQASALLGAVASGAPGLLELGDAVPAADVEVLPAAVGRDAGQVFGEISLWRFGLACVPFRDISSAISSPRCSPHPPSGWRALGTRRRGTTHTLIMDTTKRVVSSNLDMSTSKCRSWLARALCITAAQRSRTAPMLLR